MCFFFLYFYFYFFYCSGFCHILKWNPWLFHFNVCFSNKSDGPMEHAPWASNLDSRGIPLPTTLLPPVLLGVVPSCPLPNPNQWSLPPLAPGHGHRENQGCVQALGILECPHAGGSVTLHTIKRHHDRWRERRQKKGNSIFGLCFEPETQDFHFALGRAI